MRGYRFSMISLIWAVALFALTFAGLRADAKIWAQVLCTTVYFALILSILCAIYSSAEQRAFWLGFAMLGWAVFLSRYAMPALPADKNPLTYELAAILHPKLQIQGTTTLSTTTSGMGSASMAPESGMSMMGGVPMGAGSPVTSWSGPSFEQVLIVCDSWLTIFFAIAGAFIARFLACRNTRAIDSPRK